ncbi:MAG: hypothetical protein IBJ02_00555 [Brevundimonas sp.]|nr:hypothetical protein [Brevundimonas sp.]
MLMFVARGSSLAVAVGTVIPVITGAMADPAFVVPDVLLAVLLVVGALLPDRFARPMLRAGNLYALGVFSVALFGQLAAVGGATPMLALAMVAAGLNLVLLGLNPEASRVL